MIRRHEPVPRRDVWIWAALGLLCGLLLFTIWADLDESVLSRVPMLDESYYLERAAELQDESLVPDRPFAMSSLYPYLIAATGGGRTLDAHRVLDGSFPLGLRILQALMWLGTAGLLRLAARRLLPDPTAWLPPLLFLLYRPGVIDLSSALLEVPLTLAVTALLLLATPPETGEAPPGARRSVLLGVLAGVAALLRGHVVVLLPLVFWMTWRGARRPFLIAAVATALVLTPSSVHNSRQVGRLAGPSLNGGVNLYIGNGTGANGLFRTFDGFDMNADPTGAAYLSGRLGVAIPDAGVADRAWSAEAWRAVTQDVPHTLRLWVRKVWLHLVAVEFDQISPHAAWVDAAPWLRLFVVPWGLLSAGGLVGACLLWRRDRRWRLWIVAVGLLIAVQSVFFVVSRYRLVLAPALALLCAGAVRELWRARGRSLILGVGLSAAAVVAVQPWGLASLLERLEAGAKLNEAVRWQRLGESVAAGDVLIEAGPSDCRERAAVLYRAAIAADPLRPEPYVGLARVLLQEQDEAGARAVLQAGAARARPADSLRRDLANLLLERGDVQGALPVLLEQLRREPDDPQLLHNTCVALSRTGRLREAEATARHFAATVPEDPRAWIDLGVVLAQAGRTDAARDAFTEGLRRHPDHAGLRQNLSRLEAGRGE